MAELNILAHTNNLVDRSITTLGTASISILAANAGRKYLVIQNVSAVNIGVTFGATAAIGTAGTVTLVPNGSIVFEGDLVPTQAFNGIAASGSNQNVTIWEG